MKKKPEANGLKNAGLVIRGIREDRGIAQVELARRMKWDRSRLNRVERGTTTVTRKMIHEFAQVFEIQPVRLLLMCLKQEYPALRQSSIAKQLDSVIESLL